MDQMVLETQKWLNKTYSGHKDFLPFSDKELDGVTGFGTFKRLIQALQIELNEKYSAHLEVDGNFGNGTLKAMPSTISPVNTDASAENLHFIIQGSLWCKGYPGGGFDGVYGPSSAKGVKEFQHDAGITEDAIIRPYIMQGLMNTDSYKLASNALEGDKLQKSAIQKSLNKDYAEKIGLVAPNGIWERKSHSSLIKACQIAWKVPSVDGMWGNNTMNAAPTLSKGSTNTESIKLLQWALIINGHFVEKTSNFDDATYQAVYDFQDFLCLGADGIAGKNTWASLLATCGNTARKTTACDTSTQLNEVTAKRLVNNGYDTVGRYLTKVEGTSFEKQLTFEEINIMKKFNLKVFPIMQKDGGSASKFNSISGTADGIEAYNAARKFGFPVGTTIYFAVDYDALVDDIPNNIVPYFSAAKAALKNFYKTGVYGPRMVCNELKSHGITDYSFVSDMSSGFTGNIGQSIPKNWSYEQIFEWEKENTERPNPIGIDIDNVIASPRATGIPAADLKPLPEFCGGDDYKNVKNHKMELQEDGFYECSICHYRVPGPALEDDRILNEKENYTVKALLLASSFFENYRQEPESCDFMTYIEPAEDIGTQYYYMPEKCLFAIDAIRGTYKNAYSFSDSDGNYVKEYEDAYKEYIGVILAMEPATNYKNLNSPLALMLNGKIDALTSLILGINASDVTSFMLTAKSIIETSEDTSSISFASTLASVVSLAIKNINSKISKLLDVLSNTYGILDLTSPQNGNVELEEGDVYVEIIPSGLAFSKKAPSLVITFGGNSNIIKSINLGKGLTDPPL